MRNDPPKITEASAETITRPIWLVEFGFTTPLRVSTRESITFQGQLFVAAGVRYQDGSVAIYNEGGDYTARFKTTRGHLPINVWASYGESPFVDTDWREEFQGEAGPREFDDWITVQLRDITTRPEPHWYVKRPVFNHLMRKGTKLDFPTGGYPV